VDQRKIHLEDALKCFLSSVTNSTRENKYFLEDCLKILNMISMGSEGSSLIDIFQSQYRKIPSEGLIEFIPQIIARLDNNYGQNEKYINILKKLLIYIGVNHPQALLFPLIYLRKGNKILKRQHADEIYADIIEENEKLLEGESENYVDKKCSEKEKEKFETLYTEGELIVEELCKISLKLSEKVFIFMTKILKIFKDSKALNTQMLISERII
jgi:hypothetical protein